MSKIKAAVGGLNGVMETVCGWALGACAAYALLFVNLTGDGSLWGSLVGAVQNEMPVADSNVPTRTYVLPAKPYDASDREQNRMLMVPDSNQALVVTVEDPSRRPAAAMTDAPADKTRGAGPKDWRVHLKGELPTFTVYGRGDETSSASMSARGSVASAATSARAMPVVVGSAFHAAEADPDATPRPGVSDRASAVHAEGDDGMRNFLGR
jgi:hypothetical protein